jgi:hypothetical protein
MVKNEASRKHKHIQDMKKRSRQVRNKARGSALQTWLSKDIGGRNVGILGKHDVEKGPWAIECKERKAFAACKFMEQAVSNTPEGMIPMVFVHVLNKSHDDDFVIFRYKDIRDYIRRKK